MGWLMRVNDIVENTGTGVGVGGGGVGVGVGDGKMSLLS
jgi:hypothetical protein